MIEVEVFGSTTRARGRAAGGEQRPRRRAGPASGGGAGGRGAPSLVELRRLCVLAAASAGVHDGHLAIEFVDAQRITALNGQYRNQPTPTDVLSFPVDTVEPIGGIDPSPGTATIAGAHAVVGTAPNNAEGSRELGDVVICPEHTADLREAVVHGVLHLLGMDHETDDGEMLALQRELLARDSR
jgi:probable rRNA maturation factor